MKTNSKNPVIQKHSFWGSFLAEGADRTEVFNLYYSSFLLSTIILERIEEESLILKTE